jgi:hypothetical protein
MENDEGFLKSLTLWSYERGTLQYDIICALILAFIFFVPPSCFVAQDKAPSQAFIRNASPDTTVEKVTPAVSNKPVSQANPTTSP